MYVSCYGTLKRTYGNNRLLLDCEFVTTGVIRGYRLYNSGFPVAAPSPDDSMTVEVWKIPEDKIIETVHNLDCLEGHRGNNNPSSMYFRHTLQTEGDDGIQYETDTYIGNEKFWRGFTGMRECPSENGLYTWSR